MNKEVGSELKSVLIDTNTFDDYAEQVLKENFHEMHEGYDDKLFALCFGLESAKILAKLRNKIFEGE